MGTLLAILLREDKIMYDLGWIESKDCKHCLHPDGYQTSDNPPSFHVKCCKCGAIGKSKSKTPPQCDKYFPIKTWYKEKYNE
jgi:hypothetical protein